MGKKIKGTPLRDPRMKSKKKKGKKEIKLRSLAKNPTGTSMIIGGAILTGYVDVKYKLLRNSDHRNGTTINGEKTLKQKKEEKRGNFLRILRRFFRWKEQL